MTTIRIDLGWLADSIADRRRSALAAASRHPAASQTLSVIAHGDPAARRAAEEYMDTVGRAEAWGRLCRLMRSDLPDQRILARLLEILADMLSDDEQSESVAAETLHELLPAAFDPAERSDLACLRDDGPDDPDFSSEIPFDGAVQVPRK